MLCLGSGTHASRRAAADITLMLLLALPLQGAVAPDHGAEGKREGCRGIVYMLC